MKVRSKREEGEGQSGVWVRVMMAWEMRSDRPVKLKRS